MPPMLDEQNSENLTWEHNVLARHTVLLHLRNLVIANDDVDDLMMQVLVLQQGPSVL